LIAVALLASLVPSFAADNKSIQGMLIAADGTGFGGAEIRAERVDAKAAPAITRTDGAGRYVFTGLPVGTYKVTAYLGGSPMSRVKVRTSARGWVRVNFDLRLNDHGPEVDRMQRDLELRSGTVGK